MRRRLGLLATLALLVPLLAGLPQQSATADPPLAFDYWPRCLSSGYSTVDTDNRLCVISYEKNEGAGWVEVAPVDENTFGVYDEPYVDTLRDDPEDPTSRMSAIRYGLYETTISSGGRNSEGNVDPDTRWRYRVNTGNYRPKELYGTTKGTDFFVSGSPTLGYQLTLTFQPTPAAYVEPFGSCVPGSCPSTATFKYDGFVTGYITDLEGSGLSDSEIAHRTGMIRSWNADYASDPFYNMDLNAFEVHLANAHWTDASHTTVATGHYDVFLPGPYLINVLQVPDPSTLTSGTITVSRVLSGTSTTVPFTLTRESGGVRITINDITFSSPRYRIRPKPTAPGKPRWGSVTRVSPTKVRLRFYRPYADGGPNITAYQGRCRRGTGAWHYNKATGSPIYIGSLSRRAVDCQVRAQNRIGYGRWSVVKRG